MQKAELAERMKGFISDVEVARGPAKYVLEGRLANLGRVVWDHSENIISCLETVAGIECIKDGLYSLEYIPGEWQITLSCGTYTGTDLSSAVRAAVRVSARRERE